MNNINTKYFTNSLLNKEYISALANKLQEKGYALGVDYSDRAQNEEISKFVNQCIEKFIVIPGDQKEQKKMEKWLTQLAAHPLGEHLLKKLSEQLKGKKITLALGNESLADYHSLKITLKDANNYEEHMSLNDG